MMIKARWTPGVAAAFLLVACTGLPSEGLGQSKSALTYSSNLIQNPGAESGLASWTVSGTLTTVTYGASGFPGASSPGPDQRGAAFFAGGVSASTDATQLVDLSAAATDIDNRAVGYVLSAYLGGWSSDDDNARLVATFRDASHAALGTSTLGPVLARDRGTTGLVYRVNIAYVPVGTREVLFDLVMNRTTGSYDDGYADNLQFVIFTQGFEQNLVVNGDAEMGPTSGAGPLSGGTVSVVPGWNLTSNFTAVQYQSGSCPGSGCFPYATDAPASPAPGSNFFAGGPSSAFSTATQLIELTGFSSQIDSAAGVQFDLSAWFGGFQSQNDFGQLTLSYLDSTGATLTSFVLTGANAAGRGNSTIMQGASLPRSHVPVGARRASLVQQMTRTDGGYDDGYMDNISLILHDCAAGGC